MRFAYIQEVFPQNGETWIRYEIEELISRGHEVRVYATWPKPDPSKLGAAAALISYTTYVDDILPVAGLVGSRRLKLAVAHLVRLCIEQRSVKGQLRIVRALYHASKFVNDFASFQPDLIVCHFAANRALLGSILAKAFRRPYIVIMHAQDIWSRAPNFSALVNAAHEVWTISDFNVSYLTNHYPNMIWDRLRVVRLGIKLEEFPFYPNRDVDGKTILFVGRLVSMKGLDTLLKCCAILLQKGLNFKVIIIGSGAEQSSLEELSHTLQLHNHVRFEGNAPSDVVRQWLRIASVFVLPARCVEQEGTIKMDGIPVALMEAMACGTPVVSTTVSGIPELIEHGNNGLLVAPNDDEQLACAIESIWQMNATKRLALITNARKTIELFYNVTLTVDQLTQTATLADLALQ